MAASGNPSSSSSRTSADTDAAAQTQQSERAQAKRFSTMLRRELIEMSKKLVPAEARWHRRCESSGYVDPPPAHCPGPTTRDQTGRDDKSIGHPIPAHLIQPPRSVRGRGGGVRASKTGYRVARLTSRHLRGISAGEADRPTIPPWGPRGAIVRGKRFLALTAAAGTAAAAATGTAAEDASAAGSASVNDDFRDAGLSHGHTISPNPL